MNIDIEINKKDFKTHKYYEWERQYTLMENINNGRIEHKIKLRPSDIAIIKNAQKEYC